MPFIFGFLIVLLDDYGQRNDKEVMAFAFVMAFIVAIGILLIWLAWKMANAPHLIGL